MPRQGSQPGRDTAALHPSCTHLGIFELSHPLCQHSFDTPQTLLQSLHLLHSCLQWATKPNVGSFQHSPGPWQAGSCIPLGLHSQTFTLPEGEQEGIGGAGAGCKEQWDKRLQSNTSFLRSAPAGVKKQRKEQCSPQKQANGLPSLSNIQGETQCPWMQFLWLLFLISWVTICSHFAQVT